ncbi:MAG: 16S rRNA (cytidine(1402)-2'-O)-methyltransferase [Candidatus Magasanikbacteria bacterium]|jgi:16S rRNA (cytidine1402-2'-O)-methyltransferase|nr:16S rRNA (cytidine(1402)-2'-O)-methyltransferase [Candidatus Magasanikbacteria bacterium]
MEGILYIVATPIGNLSDMTPRAIETLSSVDVIYAEDSRVSKSLLQRYDIDTHPKTFHQHSSGSTLEEIIEELQSGNSVAFMSDAGTPAISDPGGFLVEAAHTVGITVVPIAGVSAVSAAMSVCGFPADKFIFMGFPPHKKKRKQFFEEVAEAKYTVCFYESPHRIEKAIIAMTETLAPDTQVCICRELTKKFESIYWGTIEEIAEMDIPVKGEFVVCVRKAPKHAK